MRKTKFDGERMIHCKDVNLEKILQTFAEVESTTSVLERMEVNGMTFRNFREFGATLMDQPTLREVKKGLIDRIYTSEIWLNNNLKDGQIKLFWNKISEPDGKEEKEEEAEKDL